MLARAVLGAALAFVASCDAAFARVECAVGTERVIATTAAKELDGIDLVRMGQGAVAVWSEPSGLFVRTLDRDGLGVGDPVRLGPRCRGGVAALATGADLVVACIVQPSGKAEPAPGGVIAYEVTRELDVRRMLRVGQAGAASRGVALAAGAQGVEVVWHDGSADAERVQWARLGADGPGSTLTLSHPGRVAGPPAVARRGEGTFVVWPEQWQRAGGSEGRVFAWAGQGRPFELARLDFLHPTLRVVPEAEHLVLAFRERPKGERKPGLYLASIAESGTALGERLRLGRADGIAPPALVECQGGLVAAVPRTYGGDYFIGLHWIARGRERRRGGQQFYEDSHAYTQAAAVCMGDHTLLLVAEHAPLDRASTALRSVLYACE